MIHPYAAHGIRYEASGVEYLLRSDTVDLGDYRDQRVTSLRRLVIGRLAGGLLIRRFAH